MGCGGYGGVLSHRLGEYGNFLGGAGRRRASMAGRVRFSGCRQPGSNQSDALRAGAGRGVRLHRGQRRPAFWRSSRLDRLDLPGYDRAAAAVLSGEYDGDADRTRGERRADANSDTNPDAEGHRDAGAYRYACTYAHAHDYGANPRTGRGWPLVLPYTHAYCPAYRCRRFRGRRSRGRRERRGGAYAHAYRRAGRERA